MLEAEETVDVLSPLPIAFGSFYSSVAGSAAGFIALITLSDSVLFLLLEKVTRCLLRQSSMP